MAKQQSNAKRTERMYSTVEVAAIVGKTPARIRQLCETDLPGIGDNPNGRGWMIPESSLPRIRDYLDAHGKDFSK